MNPMPTVTYRYELRSKDQILATGHLSWDHPLEIGDEIRIGTSRGTVDAIDPVIGSHENRLVVTVHDTNPITEPKP